MEFIKNITDSILKAITSFTGMFEKIGSVLGVVAIVGLVLVILVAVAILSGKNGNTGDKKVKHERPKEKDNVDFKVVEEIMHTDSKGVIM